MAYTGTIITEAKLAFYYGANVAARGSTADASDEWVLTAQGFLCNLVKYDIITNWATLNAIYKLLFTEYAGHYAAVMAIQYDMNGYTSRIEAEDMVNIHVFRMEKIQKLLEDSSVQDFMGV